jgi:hypothetical protein
MSLYDLQDAVVEAGGMCFKLSMRVLVEIQSTMPVDDESRRPLIGLDDVFRFMRSPIGVTECLVLCAREVDKHANREAVETALPAYGQFEAMADLMLMFTGPSGVGDESPLAETGSGTGA